MRVIILAGLIGLGFAVYTGTAQSLMYRVAYSVTNW